MNRVNTFVDYRTELMEESSKKAETDLVEESSKKAEAEIAHESSLKKAGEELEQESFKKQNLEEDKESEELKQCLEIVSDDGDDVTINATPLSTKSPTIIDYKIYKEGKLFSNYQSRWPSYSRGTGPPKSTRRPCSKMKTAERVSTIRREWIKTEERIKIDWRSRLLT
ncbi:hypothetical protein Tco_1031243 [Tanacetum coccineum]|uniref:Uncharacterized protein n=1 Tax=Tanacetum coccineum TaxID=301880 RepID=A0ABQ5G8F8_9ASTR